MEKQMKTTIYGLGLGFRDTVWGGVLGLTIFGSGFAV